MIVWEGWLVAVFCIYVYGLLILLQSGALPLQVLLFLGCHVFFNGWGITEIKKKRTKKKKKVTYYDQFKAKISFSHSASAGALKRHLIAPNPTPDFTLIRGIEQ